MFEQFQDKKMTLIADVFFNLRTLKDVIRQMSKKSRFRGPFTKNMVNGPKQSSKLKSSTFIIFIDPWERNSGWKRLAQWYAKS